MTTNQHANSVTVRARFMLQAAYREYLACATLAHAYGADYDRRRADAKRPEATNVAWILSAQA